MALKDMIGLLISGTYKFWQLHGLWTSCPRWLWCFVQSSFWHHCVLPVCIPLMWDYKHMEASS